MCHILNLTDIQKIVNAVIKETEINEEFRSLVLTDMEFAIKTIIERDFPKEIQEKYIQTLKFDEERF